MNLGERFRGGLVGDVPYSSSPETDPAARRESYVRPESGDDAVLGRAPSAVRPLMVRPCVRGQAPLIGLVDLRNEVVRADKDAVFVEGRLSGDERVALRGRDRDVVVARGAMQARWVDPLDGHRRGTFGPVTPQ